MIPIGQKVEILGNEFLREKKAQGSSMGSNSFKVDMPQYIEFYRQGRMMLDEIIPRTRPLGEINEAFADMKSGEVARSVIMFD
jgi:S-(hydroxymethyl)glutathione dehydrogenase/alcohol dehydrogenase